MGTWDSFRAERRASWEDIAEAIHAAVTMEDVISFYFPSLPRRHHRCPCPIHSGKDLNFSYTRSGYKCFVCGASGDVITFVKEVCELPTRADAMRKINADFRLDLPIDGSVSVQFSAEAAKRRAEAERKQKERDAWEARYASLMDEYARLDRIITETPWDSEDNISRVCEAKEQRARISFEIEMVLAHEPR